jgi:chromate transporter
MVAAAVNNGEGVLWLLAANFALLSLLAFGGGIAILPEMHRQAVDVYGWMTSERFTDLFAIAQGSPGPNILVVTLIGWYVAGLPGAVVATLAISGPTCVLAYFVARVWDRFREARWRRAIQAGLVPVTIGLISGSAYVIARQADTNLVAVGVTLVTAAALTFTRIHPILFLAAGGVLGLVGLI